jgi:autotransporter-associated beta strand protein
MRSRYVLLTAIGSVLGAGFVPSANAGLRYWDRTDGIDGAGAAPAGAWDAATANWNLNANGSGANTVWDTNDTAVFSAGTDATGAYTVSGTQAAAGLVVEEGTVTLSGTITTGTNALSIGSGALLSIANATQLPTTAGGSTLTLNGGTMRQTNTGSGGTFFDTDTEIILGTGGGTLSYTTANSLIIIQTATKISGGNLTKAGAGVLAFANSNTYTGSTTVNDGELRLRTVANVLPTGTAVIVNGPGIFNLNTVNQQIASLSGNGNVGTGGGTLTINGSASTTFSGALKNIANAGAGGVTTGNGRLIKSGTGVITFAGLNDITGSVTLNAGGITVSAGASLAGAIADLNVNGGTLTLNNAAQTIENFNGTGGTVALGAGHVLTTEPVSNASYAGVITGPGSLIKANSSTNIVSLTLTGNNTFGGGTTINGGSIIANGATGQALGGTASLTVNSPGGISSAFVLAKSNQVNNAAPVTLNGGTFNTGGFSEGSFDTSGNGVAGVGALTVAAASIIDLATGSSVLAFADSSAAAWAGPTLSVYNYTGTPDLGGGADRLYFGSSAAGLTPAQLAEIRFFSDAGTTPIGSGATILSTGEVVPVTTAVPEPTALTLVGLGAAALTTRRRRT